MDWLKLIVGSIMLIVMLMALDLKIVIEEQGNGGWLEYAAPRALYFSCGVIATLLFAWARH
jgi:hypothetical protein